MLGANHAFNPATDGTLWTPFVGIFTDVSAASDAGAFWMRRVEATCRASGDFRKSWKSRNFPSASDGTREGKFEPTPAFERRDNVVDANSFHEPEPA
jgi:hypothetical protein